MKTNLAQPLPIPTKIDEIELLAELDAAEGKTIFSEEPSYGDAVILELGSSTLGKPSWKNGVLVFTLQTDRGVRTLRYLTHQVRPIRSLASALRAEEGEPLANYAPDPEDQLGKEYFGFHARKTKSEDDLVTIEFRNEDGVISANVRKRNLVAWAREVARVCSTLSQDERDARLVRLNAEASRTVQIPKTQAQGEKP